MAKKSSGLGRGLSSLMGDAPIPEAKETPKVEQPIKQQPKQAAPVEPNPQKKANPSVKPEDKVSSKAVASPEKPTEKKIVFADERSTDEIKPYIEEDDHVTIKGVSERVPQEPAAKPEAVDAQEIPLSWIKPNPDQPRTHFKPEDLEELASSIEKEGLLQPILVRKLSEKEYQIIAGERRWQACKSLGLKNVPVRYKEADDDKALELALIENIQRSDLNPIEEAYGYRRLMERRNMTQSDLAQAVSKGRSTIANALRLLELPEEAQELLFQEKITAGHARAILMAPTKADRQKITEKLRDEHLSVRETEALARLFAGREEANKNPKPKEPLPKSYKAAAKGLKEVLGTAVRIKSVQGKNKIEIEFKNEQELERLFGIITAGNEDEASE